MKDRNIYEQAILEIVGNKDNYLLNTEDVTRMAELAEKFYRQGFEAAKEEK